MFLFLYMHTYEYIILYMLKSILILTNLFTNTLLRLSLAHLIVKLKFGLGFDSFAKIKNIFFQPSTSCS